MKVVLKHSASGELKELKVGFSWTIFFFGEFFGIPLFIRRLYGWAVLEIFFRFAWILAYDPGMIGILAIIELIIVIYLSVAGNKMAGLKYLREGWVFSDPESDAVKYAKGKWGIV